jgi:hypothetical protein
MCCSQCCCVNALYPFTRNPLLLAELLRNLGYSVDEVLPFNPAKGIFEENGFVAFEWIGLKNYIKETLRHPRAILT